MKVEVKIDKNYSEPTLVIYTNELTSEISDFINKIEECKLDANKIIGSIDTQKFILNCEDIESFFAEDNKVYARIENNKYKVKYKIYELEEMLNKTSFVRISNSEIVNFNKVDSLEMNISSTISLKFKSGNYTFVSRRYISKIKKYLNI